MRRFLVVIALAAGFMSIIALVRSFRSPSPDEGSRTGQALSRRTTNKMHVAQAKPWVSSNVPLDVVGADLSPHQSELAGPALAQLDEIEAHVAFANNRQLRERVDQERRKVLSSVRRVDR